jgi:hypothetical protein
MKNGQQPTTVATYRRNRQPANDPDASNLKGRRPYDETESIKQITVRLTPALRGSQEWRSASSTDGGRVACIIRFAGHRSMPRYQVLIFNESGDLAGAVDFDRADDEEAMERVGQLGVDHAELWRHIQPLEGDEAERC